MGYSWGVKQSAEKKKRVKGHHGAIKTTHTALEAYQHTKLK
ncbi:hypothetical protein BN341_8290 [Helicobacter heilmannii ASB1.4]|uniref:Uncharacterized protein n=1 Tax=Helicobacter heilmannii TaxID=35817 RepID=A0A0K2YC12_HELHE|nr:hypothetical protein BN341_8290 [Helicobacter heilmannii ASB1.4]CRI34525.1 hypothetical protein HHE01_13710 [Helicobacter heilmannii]